MTELDTEPEVITGGEALAESLGISYLQMWRWTSAGYLRPLNPEPGSGRALEWPPAELEIARRMGRLTAAGLPLAFAARMARDSWPTGELAEDITVIVTEESND